MTDPAILDVDTHLTDASVEMWRPYLTGANADYLPQVLTHEGTDRLLAGGLLLPKPVGRGVGSPLGIGAAAHVDSVEERLRFMRQMRIERAFLLPGFVGLAALDAPDPAARKTLAGAHNQLVYDLASTASEIEFVPVILPDDPQWSIAELRRWRSRTTIRAAVSRPTTHEVRPYRHGLGNPLLRHLVDDGIVLMLHGATGYHQSSPVADHFDDYRFTHVFSHPFEQMVALADLFGSGALDGGLRVAVVEAGCGWIPWFFDRLQEHFDHTGGCQPIPIDVAELARERLLVSVEPGDPGIATAVAALGDSLLAFGSDYPHWDAADPEDLTAFSKTHNPDLVHRILYQNAHDFFFKS
jgi:hypothetical protein